MWLAPAVVAAAVTCFLCWGAWRAGYDPGWLAHPRGVWFSALEPDQYWALPVTLGLWLAVLAVYWWPRRRRGLPVGLIAVAVMVALAVVSARPRMLPAGAV
jgi:hypothetical protein